MEWNFMVLCLYLYSHRLGIHAYACSWDKPVIESSQLDSSACDWSKHNPKQGNNRSRLGSITITKLRNTLSILWGSCSIKNISSGTQYVIHCQTKILSFFPLTIFVSNRGTSFGRSSHRVAIMLSFMLGSCQSLLMAKIYIGGQVLMAAHGCKWSHSFYNLD